MEINSERLDETIIASSRSKKQIAFKLLKDNILLICLILSLFIGVGVGAGIRLKDPPLNEREQMYFRFPGELLMRLLKMLIIPLIMSTLISGLASLDAKTCGRIGRRALIYYLATTFLAVILGIGLVLIIKPGKRTAPLTDSGKKPEPTNTADSFLDLIRNMFPDNIVEACTKQTKTKQIQREAISQPITDISISSTLSTIITSINNTVNNHTPEPLYDFEIRKEDGSNVLGLVVYSIAMGIIISVMGENGKPLKDFMESLGEATMRLVTIVLYYSPIGVFFLVASEVIKMKNPGEELKALALYIATVMSGLTIHGLIILPLIYLAFVRKNPFKFMFGVSQALVTALGTGSSAATLPVTYKCLEERVGVNRKITRFVLPVGATINMDGTALYEAVAALFIAQLRNVDLNIGRIIAVSITATAASIGAAAVPQAGIVTMVVVLAAAGLPADDVTKIIAVDWMLDRFRTMINVWGDSIGAGIVEKLSQSELENINYEKNEKHESQTQDIFTFTENSKESRNNPPRYTNKIGSLSTFGSFSEVTKF